MYVHRTNHGPVRGQNCPATHGVLQTQKYPTCSSREEYRHQNWCTLHWCFTGLQGLRLVSLIVFTAEWLRIKPIREATKLCTQHCTGECVAISNVWLCYAHTKQQIKGGKKKQCDRRQDYLQSHIMLHRHLYMPQSRVLSNSCVTQHQKVPELWNAPSADFQLLQNTPRSWNTTLWHPAQTHHRVDS